MSSVNFRSMILITATLCTCSLAAQSAPPPDSSQLRSWTDRTGTFTIQAVLLGLENNNIQLKKADGQIVAVPLERLCADDAVWASQRLTQPIALSQSIARIAAGATIDPEILKAASRRDVTAAENGIAKHLEEIRKSNKPEKLEGRNLGKVLVLDFDRPPLHVAFAEECLRQFDPKIDIPFSEYAWQELEWLRIRGTPADLSERIAAIRAKLPPRPAWCADGAADRLLLEAARTTFASGKAIHISRIDEKPIEFKVGNPYAMNMACVRLSYVRSPGFPPHGCRVVAYMLLSKDGGEPKPVGFHQGYSPCAYSNGLLYAFYMAMGEVKLQPDTKIFIHVESLFEAKDSPGMVVSNTLAIPVVAEK